MTNTLRLVRRLIAVCWQRGHSTPFGQRGWWWDAWENGGPTWERYQVPVSDVPRISEAFLEEERRAELAVDNGLQAGFGVFAIVCTIRILAQLHAAGVDGVFLEVHEDPTLAKSDAQNALALDYPREKLTIVVASDGSVDGTNAIVRAAARFAGAADPPTATAPTSNRYVAAPPTRTRTAAAPTSTAASCRTRS